MVREMNGERDRQTARIALVLLFPVVGFLAWSFYGGLYEAIPPWPVGLSCCGLPLVLSYLVFRSMGRKPGE